MVSKQTALLTAFGLLALGGCIDPGRIDTELITRYQEYMAERSPQHRLDATDADPTNSLRPAPDGAMPEMLTEGSAFRRSIATTTVTNEDKGVVKDPKTGVRYRRILEHRMTRTVEALFAKRPPEDPKDDKVKPIATRVKPDPKTTELRRDVSAGVPEPPRETKETVIDRVGLKTWVESLTGDDARLAHLSLQDAIIRALMNSLDIRVVSFDPEIAREDMIRAAAEFDVAMFGGINYVKTDRQSVSQFAGNVSKVTTFQAGLRQRTALGGQWELAWTHTRLWDNTTFNAVRTRHEPTLSLDVVQPLLRDAWPDVNLAALRIARINRDITDKQFREKVEQIITEVINQYWALHLARVDVQIQQKLLRETIKTLKRVIARQEIDATLVQVKQTEAAVASRRASLIRARKGIFDVQDSLLRLLASRDLNVLSGYEIIPVTEPSETRVRISAMDQIGAALQHSPLLAQARLAIAAAEITVRAAKNRTLPRLDLVVSTELQALAATKHQARRNLSRGDFLSYTLGIELEYPLGNRERLANLRRARLERLKAISEIQNLSDQIAQSIRERVRQIDTAWEELLAQREAVAAALLELRALEDIEMIRGRLTPEFLQLKLRAQEDVALAARAVVQAIVSYNSAQADLDRVTGTVWDKHRVLMPRVMDYPTDTPPGRPANGN